MSMRSWAVVYKPISSMLPPPRLNRASSDECGHQTHHLLPRVVTAKPRRIKSSLYFEYTAGQRQVAQ